MGELEVDASSAGPRGGERHRVPQPPPSSWPVESQLMEGLEGGVWMWIQNALARGAMAVFSRAPEFIAAPTLGFLARLARRFDRRHSDAARTFLKVALPDESDKLREARVLTAYRHFFRVALESHRFAYSVPIEKTFDFVDVDIDDEARAVLDAGTGIMLTSPHLGSWEVASLISARIGFQPLYVIAKPPKNKYLASAMQVSRETRGIRVLPRRGAMAAAPRVLEAGGSVGMLLDQRARTRPAIVPFFGRPARTDRSAGVLIKRMGVPLLFVSCLRTSTRPLRFQYRITRVVRPDELKEASALEITNLVNAEYEKQIRECPEQYFWLHDRFRDAPATFDELESSA